jgi:glycosyltransferase involved in cell wall biosynthesis
MNINPRTGQEVNTICAHTIVKNGMPFIGLVLRQVLPMVNRSYITISEKSNDGTLDVLKKIEKEFAPKVTILFENVQDPAELTKERQKQLDMTLEDWVLFLDDDDFWSSEALAEIHDLMEDHDVDGFAVRPYQLINQDYYDQSFKNKWFTKFFRNQPGVHYEHPWPRDLIYKGSELLYWKTNPRVPRIPVRYFHLSHIKDYSFRNQPEFKEYYQSPGPWTMIPTRTRNDVWKIYDEFNRRNK